MREGNRSDDPMNVSDRNITLAMKPTMWAYIGVINIIPAVLVLGIISVFRQRDIESAIWPVAILTYLVGVVLYLKKYQIKLLGGDLLHISNIFKQTYIFVSDVREVSISPLLIARIIYVEHSNDAKIEVRLGLFQQPGIQKLIAILKANNVKISKGIGNDAIRNGSIVLSAIRKLRARNKR
jgi:hypothetical protein